MKKISTTMLAMAAILLLSIPTVLTQTAPKSTTTNKIFIDKKGGIHDHGGTLLGHIGKNDIVKDNKGNTVYFIDRDGNVIDAKGDKLGKAKKNGT